MEIFQKGGGMEPPLHTVHKFSFDAKNYFFARQVTASRDRCRAVVYAPPPAPLRSSGDIKYRENAPKCIICRH